MAGPRFIADSAEQVRKVELDGLTALFHLPSGMTHILAPPAPQILDALAGRSGDVAEIIVRMRAHFDIEAEDETEAVAARLAELEAAGLVRRA